MGSSSSAVFAATMVKAKGKRPSCLVDESNPPKSGALDDSNRPVSFPYPKLMNSNNSVDMGAALFLCSLAAARRMGVPDDKIIYLHAGTDAHGSYHVSNRDNFYTSPAMRVGGQRALELAGLTPAEVAHCDFYSCFPILRPRCYGDACRVDQSIAGLSKPHLF